MHPQFLSQGGPLQVIAAVLFVAMMVLSIGFVMGGETIKRDRAKRGL